VIEIAQDAPRYAIPLIEVEPNFRQACGPPHSSPSWRRPGRAGRRSIDTLEPVLTHDDRIDAVAHFQRAMMMDIDQAAKAMREEEMMVEIKDFIEGLNQPTYRVMRVNGVRVLTGSSQHGWSGL
jgi:hypothetical protein